MEYVSWSLSHYDLAPWIRYCMVLFAGIAAEALIYGEAEGGENDENLFRSICVLLDPPMAIAQVCASKEHDRILL